MPTFGMHAFCKDKDNQYWYIIVILLWSLNTVLLIMNVHVEFSAQSLAVAQAMERVQADDGEGMDDNEVQDILWQTGAHLFN